MFNNWLAQRPAVAAIFLTAICLNGCKSTGGGRASLESTPLTPALPHSKMKWPTISQLQVIRSEALNAVTNANGKNPTLVYINMYPAGDSGSTKCPGAVTLELGLSYDTENTDDQPRAAGFYVKPDESANCAETKELVMDAGRALDNFLGLRPIDETGTLTDQVKLEPAKFMSQMATVINLEKSSAWNLYLKTVLTPDTLDNVQYQIEMLCLDRSTADGIYAAKDGRPFPDSPAANGSPMCPPAN